MSESRILLMETADRLFADLANAKAEFVDLWGTIAEHGFPTLLVSEAAGGFGGDWGDVCAVLRLAGYHALAAPLGEAVLARWLLAESGLEAPDGLVTIAARLEGQRTEDRFTGTAQGTAWGRDAAAIVGVLDGQLLLLDAADATCDEGQSPAGDPRDTLRFDEATARSAPTRADILLLGAFLRTALMAGALDRALERSIVYANERVQFGKPIGKFQAVQQSLAVMAEEAGAVNCAAQAAARAMDHGGLGLEIGADFEVAAAKLRANIAAQAGAAIAHQVHGAIGFTHEFGLHRWTRRLASWTSEFGSERYWSTVIGARIAAGGPDALWIDLTARSDAHL